MPKYQLLALDVDGTLVDSRNELTPATCAALRRAAEAGIQLVLATGRRYRRVLPLVEPLGIVTPLVTASGALIKRPDDHTTLSIATLPEAVLSPVLAAIHTSGYDALLYADSYLDGFDFFYPNEHVSCPALSEFFALNPGSGRHFPDLMHAPPPGIFAGFAMGTQQQMLALEEQLQATVPEQLYTHVLRSPRYSGWMCEIAPAGVTKWSAIQWLAKQWNIPTTAICAVGDDINDLPMITGAGLGVAMANAIEPLRAAADRIAPSCDEDGLVEVVRWLLDE